MKSIRDIIQKKCWECHSIDINASVLDAFTLLAMENTEIVIVMEGETCVGFIREVDYLQKVIIGKKDPYLTRVRDIMDYNIYSVSINEDIHTCLEAMNTCKIRHLLVYDGLLLKGVVTLHELMLALYEGSTALIETQIKKTDLIQVHV